MGKFVSAKAVDGPLIGDVLQIPEDGRWQHVEPAVQIEGTPAAFSVWNYLPRKVNEWTWVAVASRVDRYEFEFLEPVLRRTETLNKAPLKLLLEPSDKPSPRAHGLRERMEWLADFANECGVGEAARIRQVLSAIGAGRLSLVDGALRWDGEFQAGDIKAMSLTYNWTSPKSE